MKRGKKPKKRKRGLASRARIRANLAQGRNTKILLQKTERILNRLKELEEETRECYESVLKRYSLSMEDQEELEREWKLGLQIITDYEDATQEKLSYLDISVYNSEPLSDPIDWETSEAFWRASFDLANALGLALITIDEAGNINGEIVNY